MARPACHRLCCRLHRSGSVALESFGGRAVLGRLAAAQGDDERGDAGRPSSRAGCLVRFAGRKRGMPEWALAATRDSIAEFAADSAELAQDPDLAGPSKRFLMAAVEAGVDIEDAEALKGFIAGWNARSGPDEPGSVSGRSAESSDRDPAVAADLAGTVLQLKISLHGASKPPVWRRLQLPADTRLDRLHRIVQAAFGWEDYHLHVFEAGSERFGTVDPLLEPDFADERDFTLADVVSRPGDRIRYTYDFGDDWRHDILVEKLLEPIPGIAYPVLVTAKGACPPEDCGGVWGYETLKAVLRDPEDEEHLRMREWLDLDDGEQFDPSAADEEVIRVRLARLAA